MIKAFNKLNVYYRTAIVSFLAGVVLSLALMFLFWMNWGEIVLGLILGLLFGIIIYIINGLIEQRCEKKQSYRLATVYIFIRLALLLGFLLGMGFLYYAGNVHTFNVIAVAGGYFLVEVIFILMHIGAKQ